MSIDTLRYALRGISAYRHIGETPLVGLVSRLLDDMAAGDAAGAAEGYARLFYALRTEGYESLGQWLHHKLQYEEGPYPALVERGEVDAVLEGAARRDIAVFSALANLDCGALLGEIERTAPEGLRPVLAGLPRWQVGSPFDFEGLTEGYRTVGTGIFARYRAFLWENGVLTPVETPDAPNPDEMLGYELQRNQVIANTHAMLQGNQVNNVLLYGDSGTGKSATVKTLLTQSGFERLRLIEVQKEALAELPRLIRTLGGRRNGFILFVDDLAFDQDDRTYSILKTILEGGLERRPANVVIYATSNRRHLVRQTFSDRAGDEVDASETVQEKTSLAERFGLRIPYLTLNRPEFLTMVERMADMAGIEMERETLRAAAVKWEMHHPSRTPRIAKQFIASLSL